MGGWLVGWVGGLLVGWVAVGWMVGLGGWLVGLVGLVSLKIMILFYFIWLVW